MNQHAKRSNNFLWKRATSLLLQLRKGKPQAPTEHCDNNPPTRPRSIHAQFLAGRLFNKLIVAIHGLCGTARRGIGDQGVEERLYVAMDLRRRRGVLVLKATVPVAFQELVDVEADVLQRPELR